MVRKFSIDETERIRVEEAVAYFLSLSQHSSGGTEKKYESLSQKSQ
jgi:hypothetical protein